MRDDIRGPWGIAATVLLLLIGAVLLGGCRTPAPLAAARVRLDALTPLHPDQPMVADLEHRIASLVAQQAHVTGHPEQPAPPLAVIHATPEVPELPAPSPSPKLDRHTDAFLAQRVEAYAQLLDRDRVKKLEIERHRLAAIAADEKQKKRGELLAEAERARKDIRQEYYLPLLNARMARSTATTEHDGSKATAKRLREAEERYTAVNNRYREKLAKVDTAYGIPEMLNGTGKIPAADAQILQHAKVLLQAYDQQLKKANADLLAKKRAELTAAEATQQDETPTAPAMPTQPVPAGQLTLDVPGLDRKFRQAESERARSQQAAVRDIRTVITELQHQRTQLRTRIEQDTRQAVEAMARQQGYRVQFDTLKGPDLTEQAHIWLSRYWAP